MEHDAPIPVTVLTGFLGAGKTTRRRCPQVREHGPAGGGETSAGR